MLIKKSEITELSENVRKAVDGQTVDFRDNKEGALSILKNDIYTLVNLKNEQLNAVQKQRDLLTQYLADITHQLKTPVTSMSIMADLLETAPLEKQTEFISNIKVSLSRMEWLVTSLLKMAKLDSGSVEFTTEKISTKKLLETALEPLAILLDVKNQKVNLLNDTKLVCDKRWTSEALTNIIKNASEYSPENSMIYIDSGENPIYRWISITDAGNGIDREDMSRLFTRFEGSRSQKGYGIGLPLALSIIRGQNGDIDVQGKSNNGQGAVFTVKFFV